MENWIKMEAKRMRVRERARDEARQSLKRSIIENDRDSFWHSIIDALTNDAERFNREFRGRPPIFEIEHYRNAILIKGHSTTRHVRLTSMTIVVALNDREGSRLGETPLEECVLQFDVRDGHLVAVSQRGDKLDPKDVSEFLLRGLLIREQGAL
jgi:hypothetical protein